MGHDISKLSLCMAADRQRVDVVEAEITKTLTPRTGASEDEVRAHVSIKANSEESLPGPRARTNAKTVIIFDWDDTILCSGAITQSAWSIEELERLQEAAVSALNAAMAIGETLIVTNGMANWVQDSTSRFLPRLLPTIAKLQVVSARALYESKYPGDPFMWKHAAFQHLLTKERCFTADESLNLVALGDQMPEIEAAHLVVKLLGGPSRAKTVKFKERPTVAEIIGQLGRTEAELPRLVAEDTSGEFVMHPQEALGKTALLSAASGWNLIQASKACGIFPNVAPSLSLKDLLPLFA